MSPVRPTVQVVGRRMDAEHYRLRDFLTRTAQPYEWHEAGSAEADALLERLGLRDATLPVLVATQGGPRVAFVIPLIVGYTVGTALLQLGYQAGGALTVAGLATLLTNALPIAAGTIVLDEPVPSGTFGGLRVLAFAAVVAGAFLLARPESARQRPVGQAEAVLDD